MIDADTLARAKAVRIEDEAARRGIQVRRSRYHNGPCPHCGGTDRFWIDTRKQTFGCRWCHTKVGDVIAFVQFMDGGAFSEALETLTGTSIKRPQVAKRETRQEPDEYERRQASKAAYLWLQRYPIKSSPAETYLRKRGYAGPLPATLGYLKPEKPGRHPAMIAAFGIPDEPEPGRVGEPRGAVTAIHLTLLRPDGSDKADVKSNKIVIGRPLNRPIVLAPPNDLLGLAICEGIEDALSVHQATGLGAWAAGSAPFLPKLADTVPEYIEVVHILVDDDESGFNNGNELLRRLRARGFEVIPKLLRSSEAAQ
jgi:phage/plasmid primase-like uncharacterized protein